MLSSSALSTLDSAAQRSRLCTCAALDAIPYCHKFGLLSILLWIARSLPRTLVGKLEWMMTS